jgi:hypothetical protein
MAKKAKPKEKRVHRWRVTLITGTPARYLGYVDAPDEKSAIDEAAKEFKIRDTLRNRLVARREP